MAATSEETRLILERLMKTHNPVLLGISSFLDYYARLEAQDKTSTDIEKTVQAKLLSTMIHTQLEIVGLSWTELKAATDDFDKAQATLRILSKLGD